MANANSRLKKRFWLKIGERIARCFYRVKTYDADKLPDGGFLLLPNHVTWVDAIVLQIACPRPIRFLVHETIYKNRILNPLFRSLNAIPISSGKVKQAVREAAERIRNGEIVCIFPEGELSRNGVLLRLKRGYELIARESGAPVVPVFLDRLWGSIFSYQGGKFFKKIPRQIPYPVSVAFSEPLSPEEADIATVRQRLLQLGEFCYAQRPILRGHLAHACLRGLKKKQFDTAVIDGMDHSTISRGSLLAAASSLASYLRKTYPDAKRIAVVLPPGKGAIISNLAVVLAGKTPVNMNFTAGRSALESAKKIANLEHTITAAAFQKRLADFPWTREVILLEKLIPHLKKKILGWRALVLLAPWWLLARILRVPAKGDLAEAVLLFTSGSAGKPKGVVLSHRNILGNTSQFATMLSLNRGDAVLACLPFFHSFGCTVTLWYPLIEGVRIVTYPNPLEVAKNAALIEKYGVTLFCSTPTFLRSYIRKATPEQLRSLELIVTGAEKLPNELAEAFRARFDKEVLQGYGLTETSPVVSVNLPEPPLVRKDQPVQPTSRFGSVGKLAPGIAAQIRHPETGELLSLHETGMLWLRGPNIFEGYLNDEKQTRDVLQNGWFKTGDLARFDEDGFLYIEGRVSRFSKIGGEMVPHETIENQIVAALGLGDDERKIAISAAPDAAKGEALVLITTLDITVSELREKLAVSGLPNLWIPKLIAKVEAIPVLGSGKLDLGKCKEIAKEKAAEKDRG